MHRTTYSVIHAEMLFLSFESCIFGLFRRKSSLCIDLGFYFRLFITKNAENSACQKDQVAAIFDFVITCWPSCRALRNK